MKIWIDTFNTRLTACLATTEAVFAILRATAMVPLFIACLFCGLLCDSTMSALDSVDGHLTRLMRTDSKTGNVKAAGPCIVAAWQELTLTWHSICTLWLGHIAHESARPVA